MKKLATAAVAAYRLVGEGSARRLVTNLFGMHVSPAIVTDILKNDDPRTALALRGKKVKATVFYSEIRGSHTMAGATGLAVAGDMAERSPVR